VAVAIVTFHCRHKPGSTHSSLVICVAVAIQLHFTADINLDPLTHHWSTAWQLPYSYISQQI